MLALPLNSVPKALPQAVGGLLDRGWEVFLDLHRNCTVFTQLISQGITGLIAVHEAHRVAQWAYGLG